MAEGKAPPSKPDVTETTHRIVYAPGRYRMDSAAGEVVPADKLDVILPDGSTVTINEGEPYETTDPDVAAWVAQKLGDAIGADNVAVATYYADDRLNLATRQARVNALATAPAVAGMSDDEQKQIDAEKQASVERQKAITAEREKLAKAAAK